MIKRQKLNVRVGSKYVSVKSYFTYENNGIKLFIHKQLFQFDWNTLRQIEYNLPKNWWSASEYTTGALICETEGTIREALANAVLRINLEGKPKVKRQIRKVIKKYGIANA